VTNVIAPAQDVAEAYHYLLLRMAGRLPDELISSARRWLADGELVDLAQAVVFAALTGRVAIAESDAVLLSATLAAAGEDVGPLDTIERSDDDTPPLYGLAPVSPDVLAAHGDAIPYSLDLTGDYDGPGGPDALDTAAVAAVTAAANGPAAGATLLGLWRAWRFPAIDSPWPPARPLYLVQAVADRPDLLPALAAEIGAALEAAGEVNAQVEVFTDADALPTYQHTALGFAALLWAARPAREIRLTNVYDTWTDEHGPDFDAAHPRLDGDERDRVLAYLDGGTPLLSAPEYTDDVLSPDRQAVVPTVCRTDGLWIWTDAVSYYLREHGLEPDWELLFHIRAAGYTLPVVDAVAVHRALSVLYADSIVADSDDGTEPDPVRAAAT